MLSHGFSYLVKFYGIRTTYIYICIMLAEVALGREATMLVILQAATRWCPIVNCDHLGVPCGDNRIGL